VLLACAHRGDACRAARGAQASANAAEKKNEELLGTLQSKLSSLKSVSAMPRARAALPPPLSARRGPVPVGRRHACFTLGL